MNRIKNILLIATTLLFSQCNAPTPPNKKNYNELEVEKMTASDSIHENLRVVRGIRHEARINPRYKIHALKLLETCQKINDKNKLNLKPIIEFEYEQLSDTSNLY